MPEITVTFIAIAAGALALGAVVGWIFRGNRCLREKIAVNEGWQQQLEAQRSEHDRLIDQNKTLMEQISQFQASGKDASNRARELSAALKEAFARRDELQRELKEIRSNLEVAVRQRDKLHADMQNSETRDDSVQQAIKERDERIFSLSRELENWQGRLPPLLERYRQRDQEAAALDDELAVARNRIEELENLINSDETRIEPVDPEALGDELDASNDPSSVTQTGLDELVENDGIENDEIDDEVSDGLDAEIEAAIEAEAEELADELDAEIEAALETETFAEESAEDVEELETSTSEAADEPAAEAIDDDDTGDYEDETAVDETTGDEAGDDQEEELPASAEIAQLHDHEPGSLRDNLRLIKGVGPAIEKTLNELGIFRFHQIAEMTEYDIDRVAQRLKGFRTRIYREDWIGQARDLQLQKSGT